MYFRIIEFAIEPSLCRYMSFDKRARSMPTIDVAGIFEIAYFKPGIFEIAYS